MRAIVALLAVLLCGCFPSFEDRPWLVDKARVVGVRGVPAEARPNERVQFEALIASPSGTLVLPVQWAFCMAPRSIEERTGVTASCANGANLQPITNPAPVIADACARFGPNPPPTSGDEPPRRPADPDPSGGYYVPVRALVVDPSSGEDVASFGFQRIRCDLAGATRAIFEEYQDRYTENVNPSIGTVVAVDAAGVEYDASSVVQVAAGATLGIAVTAASDASEPYIVYEAENNVLRDHLESLEVSWSVSGGSLSRARQTLGESELSGGVFETTWTAPTAPGAATIWIVLRDARGGSSWRSLDVMVE